MTVVRTGLYADEIHQGTLINGQRVASLKRGLRDGRPTVTVRTEGRDRRGRKQLSDPVTYTLGTRTIVPGTARPTTWHMQAGPVHRKPGAQLNGGWWGDGDDTGRDARADRHHRMIESVTYA